MSSKIKAAKLAVIAFLAACVLLVLLLGGGTSSATPTEPLVTGMADPEALLNLYKEWEAEYEKNGGDRNLVLPLHWSKGLSDEHTKATGYAKLDMIEGKVLAEVKGLPEAEGWDFWLVENRSGPGLTVLPEQGDVMVLVGSLKREGKLARVQAELGGEAFANFRPDLVIVTRAGKSPEQSRVLTGNTSLFNSLYRSAQLGRFGVLDGADGPQPPAAEKRGLFGHLLNALAPTAKAQGPPPGIPLIVAQGREIFLNQTFEGNGRTCASCHREENSLTIDPNFIATLDPVTDKLFIAEQDPNLETLERPELMRNVGLILENVDGFDDLEKKFVMRGVPHTLALPTSIRSNLVDDQGVSFVHALGWSGDGSPSGETFDLEFELLVPFISSGSLRDFALGAVRQHFTRDLRRRPNIDFRFPTIDELNKLEAFQLSTGRQRDLQLAPGSREELVLRGALAKRGQELFLQSFGTLSCNTCHANAGAIFGGSGPDNGFNANRNTRLEDLEEPPGKIIDPTIPRDGGFGKNGDLDSGFGDGTFNIPTVVESAFSPPFFHNNALSTIESATQNYEFSFGPLFFPPNGIAFQPSQGFTPDRVQAIAAFIRVIGALEKIRSANNLEERARRDEATDAQARKLLQLSQAELNQGINVLTAAQLHPVAVAAMRSAIALDQEAIETTNPDKRKELITKALSEKARAKKEMQVQGP